MEKQVQLKHLRKLEATIKMKNKEVFSGLIGGSFFTLTYLALGLPILPALLVGTSAFIGGELLMSKTNLLNFERVNEKNIDEVLKAALLGR